jgi:hypothetical protein
MKTFSSTLGLAVALMLAIFASPVRAQDNPANADSSVSFQTFYNQLANQGTWVETDKYGYVFQPDESDPNWRPYTYGHWVNTDAGMTWVSDDSFGWATDHYGRWVNLDGSGWAWVPGYTWAPAWVSWRQGVDDVGWAPLPPDSDQGIDYYADDDYYTDADFGYHIGDDCDVAYGIGPWYYNFCPIAFIGDRDSWRHFHDRGDNFGFIGRTRNVTNINFRRDGVGFGRVHAEGPSVAGLNARAHTPIEHANLLSASRLNEAGLHGNTLAVFHPRIDAGTIRTARPESVARTIANTQVNRGTEINRPLTVNSNLHPENATAEQVRAALQAQGSANARVATGNTHFSHALSQPFTSLHTGTRSAALNGNAAHFNSQQSEVNRSPVTPESRFTGEASTRNFSEPTRDTSRFAGESATPHAFVTPRAQAGFSGENFRQQTVFPSRTEPVFHNNPSAFSGEAYHPSHFAHTSSPSFHASAPAFHAQPIFHASAPTMQHFNGGGGLHGAAPAAHVSSGGGHAGGGRR